jgi:hypothetical protein
MSMNCTKHSTANAGPRRAVVAVRVDAAVTVDAPGSRPAMLLSEQGEGADE